MRGNACTPSANGRMRQASASSYSRCDRLMRAAVEHLELDAAAAARNCWHSQDDALRIRLSAACALLVQRLAEMASRRLVERLAAFVLHALEPQQAIRRTA